VQLRIVAIGPVSMVFKKRRLKQFGSV